MLTPYTAARRGAEEPRRRVANGPVFVQGRRARRLPHGAPRQPRARRRGPGDGGDDRRVGRRAASRPGCPGCGTTSRRAPSATSSTSSTSTRARASACSSAMPGARLDAARLAAHDHPLAERQLAADLGFGAAVSCRASRSPARDEPRRHGARARRLRRGHPARRGSAVRLAGAAGRPWLPAVELHLPIDQLAQRRIRRLRSRTACASRWKCSGGPRRMAAGPADLGAHLGHRLGRRAASTADDAVAMARMFKEAGADMIDCSTGEVTPDQKPVYGRMFQRRSPTGCETRPACRRSPWARSSEADQVNGIIAPGRSGLGASRDRAAGIPPRRLAEAIPVCQGSARTHHQARRGSGLNQTSPTLRSTSTNGRRRMRRSCDSARFPTAARTTAC